MERAKPQEETKFAGILWRMIGRKEAVGGYAWLRASG